MEYGYRKISLPLPMARLRLPDREDRDRNGEIERKRIYYTVVSFRLLRALEEHETATLLPSASVLQRPLN